MLGLTPIERAEKPGYAACSGCSLCLLVCPVWRSTHDLRLTPHGRAKALQHGATIDDVAPSVEACTLCGACEPVCPENIGLVDMLLDLRRALPLSTIAGNLQTRMQTEMPRALVTRSATATVLLSGMTLAWEQMLLARVRAALGDAGTIAVAADHGADISLALEIGAVVPPQRIERFLAPLRQHKTVIVADGLLLRHVRAWLPASKIVSLGAALSSRAAVRKRLRADDLYVIEPRAYHADHARLVTHYDNLRAETGCAMNLDLQRIAIPATMGNFAQLLGRQGPSNRTQVRWLLKGRRVSRIVVENADDRPAFQQQCDIPVVHLAEVADDGHHEKGQP
jgi:ferredoxin